MKDFNLPPFLVSLAANYGIMAANYANMAANQGFSCAAKGSFIRNSRNCHLQVAHFSYIKELSKVTGRCRNGCQGKGEKSMWSSMKKNGVPRLNHGAGLVC